MSVPGSASTPALWTVALIVGLIVPACAPKTAHLQTDIMEQSHQIGVTAAVLRARVNDLVERAAGRIELTADRISRETDDVAIRRRALVLKVDAIPAVYGAGFRADPLGAAVDVWVFAFQFSHYMETGGGRGAFGAGQPLAAGCGRDVIVDADAVMKSIATKPEYFDHARLRVENWARTHPVEYMFSARASGGTLVADLRSENRDVFLTVGAVSDLIENLSERFNSYAAQVPKQARWQAELLVAGTAGTYGVEGALGDVHDLGIAARHATTLLDNAPALVDAERDIIAAERRVTLADVDRQREQTLAYLTAERLVVLAAAREERLALVAALTQERIATLTEMDAIKSRAIDSTLSGVKALIDYTIWRMAVLTCCLIAATALAGVIAYRLATGHRRGTVTS